MRTARSTCAPGFRLRTAPSSCARWRRRATRSRRSCLMTVRRKARAVPRTRILKVVPRNRPAPPTLRRFRPSPRLPWLPVPGRLWAASGTRRWSTSTPLSYPTPIAVPTAVARSTTARRSPPRRLAASPATAPFIAILDREETPLRMGRRTRAIPPALRRALLSRDRSCRFPGCERHRFTDAHHIRHWANGGETSVENLVLLCRYHHRLVHEGGFAIERTPRGGIAFRHPGGWRIAEAPGPPASDPSQLPAANRRSGLRLDHRTCLTGTASGWTSRWRWVRLWRRRGQLGRTRRSFSRLALRGRSRGRCASRRARRASRRRRPGRWRQGSSAAGRPLPSSPRRDSRGGRHLCRADRGSHSRVADRSCRRWPAPAP